MSELVGRLIVRKVVVKMSLASSSPPSRTKTFKRLAVYCGPEGTRIVVGLSALIVNALTNLSFPYIMGQAVDRLTDTSNEAMQEFVIGTTGIFVVGSIATWVRVYCLGTSSELIKCRMRKQLFDSYIDNEVDFFDSNKNGELLTILENDTKVASEAFTDKLAAGLRSINSSLNGSILLFCTSPSLCGVSLGIVPLIGVGAMTMAKYSKKIGEKLRVLQGEVVSYALERFAHISTVKLNNKTEYEKSTFGKQSDESLSLASTYHSVHGSYMSFISIATNISLVSVLYVGGGLIKKGQLSAGTLTRFAVQSAFVGLGFAGLATFYTDMTKALDAAGRVFTVLDSNEKAPELPTTVSPPSSAISTAIPPGSISSMLLEKKGRIEFCNVFFTYKNRSEVLVLNDFNMAVIPSCINSVVGKSGSGKSTILSLVCGLYKPSSGNVYIDGCDITKVPSNVICDSVGVVEQRAGLLSGTIYSNVAYGKTGATKAEIEQACKDACCHDFILSFPNGYNEEIGENSKFLSGGQSTRIALARALVKNPSYLLLDEVTAALDKESEKEIIEILTNLAENQNKTIIIFTHSDYIMQKSRVINLVGDGKIRASGDYQKIIKENNDFLVGLKASLVNK